MSTNAAIGLAMPDGTIKAVYLHWDGYITDGGAGETLSAHYKDRTKVEKLIALGFLSSLGAEVDPDPATPHSWSNPQPGVTVAYHRDRKEPLHPAIKFKGKDSFAGNSLDVAESQSHDALFCQAEFLCDLLVRGIATKSFFQRQSGILDLMTVAFGFSSDLPHKSPVPFPRLPMRSERKFPTGEEDEMNDRECVIVFRPSSGEKRKTVFAVLDFELLEYILIKIMFDAGAFRCAALNIDSCERVRARGKHGRKDCTWRQSPKRTYCPVCGSIRKNGSR